MSGPNKFHLIVDPSVTVGDIARALQNSGLTISNTIVAQVFAIRPLTRQLPANAVDLASVRASRQHKISPSTQS